nr:ribonuclease H-like domain-containing protein [Tanacetum cinerariifolium]
MKTQDNLRQWDLSSNANLNLFQCPLCESQSDSHDHLFFECVFSLQVWNHIKIYAGTPRVAASLNAIIDHIITMFKKKTTRSMIVKLVFTASTYFIWQERNYRLFKNQKRSPNQIIDRIKIMVRLKLLTCSFLPHWLLEDSALSMVVYGSRLECHSRVVLFFPSSGFFPLDIDGFLCIILAGKIIMVKVEEEEEEEEEGKIIVVKVEEEEEEEGYDFLIKIISDFKCVMLFHSLKKSGKGKRPGKDGKCTKSSGTQCYVTKENNKTKFSEIPTEVRGYVEAVLNSLGANVPKAFVMCQVEKAKEGMLNNCPVCKVYLYIAPLGYVCELTPDLAERLRNAILPMSAQMDLKSAIQKGLHKGYDRFESISSQLKTHGAGVSTEDANQKFISTNSTNEVSTAYGVSTSSGHNSQKEGSSSYTDDLMYSFFANQSSGPQLDHEDLEQIDEFDLEKMDLKWQVAMIFTRLKNFYKKTERKLHFDAKEPVGLDKTKIECFNCHNTGHFARECRSKGNQEGRKRDAGNIGFKARDNARRRTKQGEHKAMVTIDGEGLDWTEAEKEKEELKIKIENFQSSSEGLSKLLNSQMSAKDKSGLRHGNQIHKGVLSYENEFLKSVFDSQSSDVEDSLVNDRFVKVEGMHVSKANESDVKTNNLDSCKSNSSVDTLESVPKQVESKPKAVSEPKVWSDAPIIKEYESNSNDEYVFKALVEQEKPNCAFINIVKHVKTPRQTVKDQDTCSQNPKVPKRDWTGLMSKRMGLGYGYTRKECFVCGSFSHLIRDCDFHEKRMAKQVELNKSKNKDNPHQTLKRKVIVNSGCLRHMTGNKAYLVEYQDFYGGHVAFGGSKRQITGKGKVRTGKLDFKDVYFVKELQHFNLFSVSQMCDKKNKVLFIDTEYLVLSPNFKLPDENQILLRFPLQKNMYSFNLENIVPSGGLDCLIAKATVDESNKWHMRLGYVNFKNINKLVKGNLVRGLPSKIFQNDHTCVACHKRKQHKASRKAKLPVTVENKANITAGPKETNNSAGTQDNINAGNSKIEAKNVQEYCVLPLWSFYTSTVKSSEAKNEDEKLIGDTGSKTNDEPVDREDQSFLKELERLKRQEKKADGAAETLRKMFAQVNTASTPINTASPSRNIPSLEDIYEVLNDGIFTDTNVHIMRKAKRRLKRLDQEVAAYLNGYDPLAYDNVSGFPDE